MDPKIFAKEAVAAAQNHENEVLITKKYTQIAGIVIEAKATDHP